MALSFNNVKGEAERSKTPSYKFKEGENRVRFIGDVLARYIYWIPGADGKDKTPVECLSFNRDTEKFDNVEKDWVKEYYPDLKAEWAYASLCYDDKDPTKILIFNHKKKLFSSIVNTVADLGNPADLKQGWTAVFTRKKTGPKVFNVEYTLDGLKSSKTAGPVHKDMLELIEAHPNIDAVLKRAPAEDIKKYLDKLRTGATEDSGETAVDSIPKEFE
jgi:hypothetical protein